MDEVADVIERHDDHHEAAEGIDRIQPFIHAALF
jgi:hypothetical protein